MTKDKILQQKRELLQKVYGPKSRCTCGHSGDDNIYDPESSDHGAHIGIQGHGMCTYPGCDCIQFTWSGFLPSISKMINEVNLNEEETKD